MKKWKEMFIVVNKALEIAKIHKRELNNIIFLGGQTRIPKIEETFRKSKFNNRIYNFKIN
jgi:molecular chaperone DnaK (HSP70)